MCEIDAELIRVAESLVRLYRCSYALCELKELHCQHLTFLKINVVNSDVLLCDCLYGLSTKVL